MDIPDEAKKKNKQHSPTCLTVILMQKGKKKNLMGKCSNLHVV